MRLLAFAALFWLAAAAPPAASRWWMDEPVRLLQTNLRETDSTLDATRLVQQVADFPANALLFNMGGIVAQYPTRAEFHYASRHLPPGRDLFGEMLEQAHARGIRVIGRFDFSKTQKPVFEARPEWFFKGPSGEPAVYNGLYSACINGDYYREHALTILTEALERYPVDGLFFNMFGNPTTDYSGNAMGRCQCNACQARFRARYGRPLSAATEDEYRQFMDASAREVAALFAELIHRKRLGAAFLTYIAEHTDGIMSESNTAVGRPLPLWPYSASDNVNRARNTQPDKMAFNLCMSFLDFPWLSSRCRPPRSSYACTRTSRTAGRRPSPCSAPWTRRTVRPCSRPGRSSSGTRSTRTCTSASGAPRASCSCAGSRTPTVGSSVS
jgi:hypothetical protein